MRVVRHVLEESLFPLHATYNSHSRLEELDFTELADPSPSTTLRLWVMINNDKNGVACFYSIITSTSLAIRRMRKGF